PAAINSLNPETGAVYWSQPFARGKAKEINVGLAVSMPRLDGDKLFVTAFYEGCILLKLNATEKPTVVWRSNSRGEKPDVTDGLHSIMPTPFIKDGYIYGVCSYGELRCLDEKTGQRVWETHQATTGKSARWGNAFLVRLAPGGNGKGLRDDRFVLFNERGDLILASLTPKGYTEISRANVLTPTNSMPGRPVIWSHPAFANRCCYARNDREIVCVSLAAEN
ncbi:MAG TPA: PQQ-binding-like beta-propeller repeat protein, partial [Gemmataceae bacterium]|nr:PQQ-binding-like beta-propeller repeat protein [Gemmataceae bacterium]